MRSSQQYLNLITAIYEVFMERVKAIRMLRVCTVPAEKTETDSAHLLGIC
jgi:hypothetical protein